MLLWRINDVSHTVLLCTAVRPRHPGQQNILAEPGYKTPYLSEHISTDYWLPTTDEWVPTCWRHI